MWLTSYMESRSAPADRLKGYREPGDMRTWLRYPTSTVQLHTMPWGSYQIRKVRNPECYVFGKRPMRVNMDIEDYANNVSYCTDCTFGVGWAARNP